MTKLTKNPKGNERKAEFPSSPKSAASASRREFLQVTAGGTVGALLATACANGDFVESSSAAIGEEFAVDFIKSIVLKCAKYRLSRGVTDLSDFYRGSGASWRNYIWDVGAYMSGVAAGYRLTRDPYLLDNLMKYGDNAGWKLVGGAGDSNAWCPLQVFVDVYLFDRNPANLDKMCKGTLDAVRGLIGSKSTSWALVDWIYMSPTCVPRVCNAYKDSAGANVGTLLDNLGASWRNTANDLLNSQYHLWWRDSSYKNTKTPNGSLTFWSGGNAWGIGALARVLEYMPAGHKDLPYYIKQFQDNCEALRTCPGLGKDGMWRTSLLDYNQYPQQDSISSAFFGYCFAFGINRGYLDRATYEPFVRNTWSSLVKNIANDGRLQWCQGVTEKPTSVSQANSAPEGEGAFMLMAEELVRMLNGGGGGGTDGGDPIDSSRDGGGGGGGGGSNGGSDGSSRDEDHGRTSSAGGAGGGISSNGGAVATETGGTSIRSTPAGSGGKGGGSAGNTGISAVEGGTSGCGCTLGSRGRGGKWGVALTVGAVLAGQLGRLRERRQTTENQESPGDPPKSPAK